MPRRTLSARRSTMRTSISSPIMIDSSRWRASTSMGGSFLNFPAIVPIAQQKTHGIIAPQLGAKSQWLFMNQFRGARIAQGGLCNLGYFYNHMIICAGKIGGMDLLRIAAEHLVDLCG